MPNYDPYFIADRILLGIEKHENRRLRDDLNYARQETLLLKYLHPNVYFYDSYYYDYRRHHHKHHHRHHHDRRSSHHHRHHSDSHISDNHYSEHS
jgi:hypothetical protein